MKLYTHLKLEHANTIIVLANKGTSRYKIKELTGISKGKIERCLEKAERVRVFENKRYPWKKPHIQVSYSFKLYQNTRDQEKMEKAYKFAEEAVTIYQPFLDFCSALYEKKILRTKAKRSALEYIKEFRRAFPNGDAPGKSWVYEMAKSIHYEFNPEWLPSSKPKVYRLKSDDESKKGVKYNPLSSRQLKEELRKKKGNFEIDSVIGKRTDKQALLTLIDIHSGDFYSRFYDRTMEGFKEALKYIIKIEALDINTLTMDNGGENNKLGEILPKEKMFNCRPYCSGEKGTLENKHRLIRRVIPKGVSLDNYTNEDIEEVNEFVNNYYSKTFNRVK